MLIILSPAKTMDMSAFLVGNKDLPKTTPSFINDSIFLVSKMRNLSIDELKKQLKISDSIAKINFDRYQSFDISTPKQAIFAYNGSVYKAIKAKDFSTEQLKYAQDRIRIISTLYGSIRPLDMIKAYRIAFDMHLEGIDGNLYDYWLPKLTDSLIEDAHNAGNIIINLASMEIMGSIDTEKLEKKIRVITPEFKEYKDGKYETVRTYTKIARGEMTKYIIQNRIEEPEKLKKFTWKEFTYNDKLSNKTTYIFTRTNNK